MEGEAAPGDYSTLLAHYDSLTRRASSLDRDALILKSENSELKERNRKLQELNDSLLIAQEKAELDIHALNKTISDLERGYEEERKESAAELARCQAEISYLEQSRNEWASASAQVTRYRKLAEDLASHVEELERELESNELVASSQLDGIPELEKALGFARAEAANARKAALEAKESAKKWKLQAEGAMRARERIESTTVVIEENIPEPLNEGHRRRFSEADRVSQLEKTVKEAQEQLKRTEEQYAQDREAAHFIYASLIHRMGVELQKLRLEARGC